MAVCDNGNGIKTKLEIERRDLVKLAAFIVSLLGVILGAAAPLAMYVFQTRAQALAEHAALGQATALHEQEVRLRHEYEEREKTAAKKEIEDTIKILWTLDANQRQLMRNMGVRKSKIEPLPSGVSFDDLPGGDEEHE